MFQPRQGILVQVVVRVVVGKVHDMVVRVVEVDLDLELAVAAVVAVGSVKAIRVDQEQEEVGLPVS